MAKRFTIEVGVGAWTVSYDSLGPIVALAKDCLYTHQPYRIYTVDAEGDMVDGQQVWHDGLTQVEREVLHEAGVM